MTKLNKLPLNLVPAADIMNQVVSADFRVAVKAQEDSVDILIHGVIGDDWVALDSGSIAGFLKENRGKTLNVDINSPGGLAYDGVATYNALSQHDAPVNVTISGIAASAASIIAMAGDSIRIAENASFMIHRAWGIGVGNKKAMLDLAAFLDKLDNQIAATYAARTGRKAETMMKMMDGSVDGTTFSGAEAVSEGFATELIPLKKKAKDGQASLSTDQFANEAKQRLQNSVAARLRTVQIDGEAA